MSASVLCQRALRLWHLRGLRTNCTSIQHFHSKTQNETEEQQTKKEAFQTKEASVLQLYKLHYNPSSYHHNAWNSAPSIIQTDDDEDGWNIRTDTHSPWQESKSYRINHQRHLSCIQNTTDNSALDNDSEAESSSLSPVEGNVISTNFNELSRSFQKCRPQYADITIDLTQRPQQIELEEAFSVLKRVGSSKSCMKPSQVSHFLFELSHLNPDKMPLLKSNTRFIMLLRNSVENLPHFTDLELLEVLQSFVWLDMSSAHSMLWLYETELKRRVKHMTLHQLLLAADIWRCIGRKVPKFLQCLYELVPLKKEQIGISELIQLFYIVGEGRHCPKSLSDLLEKLLLNNLQFLHPEEIGIVCLGLFKSKTQISHTTVTCIVDKAHSCVKEISDFALVNVMKLLRFSYMYHIAWMEAMEEEVPRRAPEMSIPGMMHVALTCSSVHYRNSHILTAIAEQIPSLAPHCRTKDTCKLLWAFGNLRFYADKKLMFYSTLIEAMRQRKAEFRHYPEHLLTGLLGLVFVSQFPRDLITLVLSPEFVKVALNNPKLDLKNDLFLLDGAVALEFPRSTGPRLCPKLRKEAAEQCLAFAQSHSYHRPEVLEAESVLQELLGGEQFVRKTMILPFTRTIDLEVHLDSEHRQIPINLTSNSIDLNPENSAPKSSVSQSRETTFKEVSVTEKLIEQLTLSKSSSKPATSAPKDPTSDFKQTLPNVSDPGQATRDAKGVVKLAIQVSNKNHHIINSYSFLGIHALKRRLLKLAGYRVVELIYPEWTPLLKKSRTERLIYMHCKLFQNTEKLN